MKLVLTFLLIVSLISSYCVYQHFRNSRPLYPKETLLYQDKISQIAKTVNSAQTTWKAGTNTRWLNMGIDAIKGQMGSLKNTMKVLPTISPLVNDIPDEFDSRETWPDCDSIKEVRDQANCGSCWSFGAAEAMSDRYCIASNQTQQARVATEDLLTCCDACGSGCNGGWTEMAWNWFVQEGLVTGDLYGDNTWCRPYTFPPCDHHTEGQYGPCPDIAPTPMCNKTCNDDYEISYSDDKIYASEAYAIAQNVTNIQSEIMTNGPVEAAFTVYEDFLAYKSGVYQHTTGDELGGHAIKVLGWGVEDSVPYWLIANSWNPDWGDQGFFKILRGSNHCGIEQEVFGGIPTVKKI